MAEALRTTAMPRPSMSSPSPGSTAIWAGSTSRMRRTLLQQAVDSGYPPAVYFLADLMRLGLGGPQDELGAMDLYREAARAGNADAAFMLGQLARLGTANTPPSPAEACSGMNRPPRAAKSAPSIGSAFVTNRASAPSPIRSRPMSGSILRRPTGMSPPKSRATRSPPCSRPSRWMPPICSSPPWASRCRRPRRRTKRTARTAHDRCERRCSPPVPDTHAGTTGQ